MQNLDFGIAIVDGFFGKTQTEIQNIKHVSYKIRWSSGKIGITSQLC